MKNLLAAVAVLVVSTAHADTIFVDASCPGGDGSELDPYCSIQTAIDNAVDTDEVVVAPGTYFETIDFLGKAVTLRSTGGPEVTIIDAGGILGAGSVVTCDSGERPGSVLQGFTITGGFASLGGGMYNANSSPTVIGCVFSSNVALNSVDGRGGGMYNENSSPTVIDCTFDGNSAVAFNAGKGGGMYNQGSNPAVIGCTFRGNSTTLSFDAAGGGMYNQNSSPIIMNCLFDANVSLSGGGMCNININSNSSPTVTNCTFSGNLGGGIVNFSINAVLTNCVLWANDFGQIVDIRSSSTVSYGDVQGGWPGIGNIDADPLFVDPDNGDFRLSAGSPCIDAGHNNAISDLADTDQDGNPRFADDPDTDDTGCGVLAIVDMGSYEFQGVPATVVFADLNGDGIVTFIGDLMILNGCVGSDDPDCCLADLDLDGVVGMSDRILMWGELIKFLPVR